MLSMRRHAEMEERLAALAKAVGRTKSFYAREAILANLDDLKDRFLAERRLIDIRAGKLLKLVRGHWGIETRLHCVRDFT